MGVRVSLQPCAFDGDNGADGDEIWHGRRIELIPLKCTSGQRTKACVCVCGGGGVCVYVRGVWMQTYEKGGLKCRAHE